MALSQSHDKESVRRKQSLQETQGRGKLLRNPCVSLVIMPIVTRHDATSSIGAIANRKKFWKGLFLMEVYYQLIRNSGHTVRYASTDKQVVLTHGYPIYLQIYGTNRSIDYVLKDTFVFLATQYGNNIKLVNVDELEKK